MGRIALQLLDVTIGRVHVNYLVPFALGHTT